MRPTSAISRYAFVEYEAKSVGRDLAVDLVLLGGLRIAGDRLRATPQLISVETGETVWAKSFDEKLSEIFALEDSISEKVAAELIPQITPEERQQLTKHYTENIRAYALYERGRFLWHKSTPPDILRAIELFQQAIDLDPRYALAYAGIADAWVLLGCFGHQIGPAFEAMENAETAALKALEIDSLLAEAHYALGSVYGLYRWKWASAQVQFNRALELKPTNPIFRSWYALCLAARKEFKEAREQIDQAILYDPTSFLWSTLRTRVLFLERNYDEAIKQAYQAIELERFFFLSYLFLGHVLRERQEYSKAMEAFQTADALSNHHPVALAEIAIVNARIGDTRKAEKMLRELRKTSLKRFVSPCLIAHIHLALNDQDSFFHWLEKGYDERSVYLIFLTTEPLYEPIREDPRFIEMVNRVGFAR